MNASHNADRRDLQLRVLSGPHQGASVALSPGNYCVGRSDRCDVIPGSDRYGFDHRRFDLIVGGIGDDGAARIRDLDRGVDEHRFLR